MSWCDHEYNSIIRLRLFWDLQLFKKKRQCIYERLKRFIHDEEIWIMGCNFNMRRFFSQNFSKVSYIFTDPIKILYVAELIEFFKRQIGF